MTEPGIKEVFYIRLLPADEMAEYICSLPYTLVETIIEAALKDEDGVFDLLTEAVNILKKNLQLCNAKKAMRKLLKVYQVLGCVGYFDFGDWKDFRDNETMAVIVEPPTPIKNFIKENGQLNPQPINGQYKPINGLRQFIILGIDNHYEDVLTVPFILHYIYHDGLKDRSIREYINEAKRLKKAAQ
jgi:hypothetical protein